MARRAPRSAKVTSTANLIIALLAVLDRGALDNVKHADAICMVQAQTVFDNRSPASASIDTPSMRPFQTTRLFGHESDSQVGRGMIPDVFSRLTENTRKVLFFARQALSRYGGTTLQSEHILLGLLQVAPESIEPFMASEWTTSQIRDRLSAAVTSERKLAEDGPVQAGMGTQRVLRRAAVEADELGSEYVRVEHFALALVSEEGLSGQVLRDAGVKHEQILRSLRKP